MEEMYDSEGEIKTSKINSGMLTNLTLNQLYLDFFKTFRQSNYNLANNNLDCIWIILSGDADKDDTAEYLGIETRLAKLGLLGVPKRNGFKKMTDNDRNSMLTQKILLTEKASFLRKLMNKQGKGTAYYDENEEAAE